MNIDELTIEQMIREATTRGVALDTVTKWITRHGQVQTGIARAQAKYVDLENEIRDALSSDDEYEFPTLDDANDDAKSEALADGDALSEAISVAAEENNGKKR